MNMYINMYICTTMDVTYCIYAYTVSTFILEMTLAEYRERQIHWFNIVFPIRFSFSGNCNSVVWPQYIPFYSHDYMGPGWVSLPSASSPATRPCPMRHAMIAKGLSRSALSHRTGSCVLSLEITDVFCMHTCYFYVASDSIRNLQSVRIHKSRFSLSTPASPVFQRR